MKRINRPNKQAVLHYITINVRDRKPIFTRDAYARAALVQLSRHCDAHPAKLVAYVTMPEHLHFVLNPRDGDINGFLAQFKPAVTEAVTNIATELGHQRVLDWLMVQEGHRQLWQDGKHDLYLYSDWMIWQKIHYIHNNPLKRRLVKHAYEYPYSSFAARYDTGRPPIIPVDFDWWWEDLPILFEE